MIYYNNTAVKRLDLSVVLILTDPPSLLQVMIYLIDKVLPESYFANNLRSLSVDMAVFRDLLRMKLPHLSQHLHLLQKTADREAGGGSVSVIRTSTTPQTNAIV